MHYCHALLASLLAATPLGAQQDSTWRDHDRAARDARVRGDWAASRAHVERMEITLSGHPAIIARSRSDRTPVDGSVTHLVDERDAFIRSSAQGDGWLC